MVGRTTLSFCVCIVCVGILELVRVWPQNTVWTYSADKQVAPYRKGKSKDEIVINRVSQTPAKKVPDIKKDYKAATVEAAWDNHFAAFGSQDVTRIMQDYTEKSVLKAFDHTTGMLLTAKGLAQITQFFVDLFEVLSDPSALAAPVIRIMEGTSTLDGSVGRAGNVLRYKNR